VRDIVLAPDPFLGDPLNALHRACGVMCVVAGLQEGELYVSCWGIVNDVVRVIGLTGAQTKAKIIASDV
jgi:hypothetical protein